LRTITGLRAEPMAWIVARERSSSPPKVAEMVLFLLVKRSGL
jgi:hypothetical protein